MSLIIPDSKMLSVSLRINQKFDILDKFVFNVDSQ